MKIKLNHDESMILAAAAMLLGGPVKTNKKIRASDVVNIPTEAEPYIVKKVINGVALIQNRHGNIHTAHLDDLTLAPEKVYSLDEFGNEPEINPQLSCASMLRYYKEN